MATISVSSELKYKLDMIKAQKTVENGRVLSFDELLTRVIDEYTIAMEFLNEFSDITDSYENGAGSYENFKAWCKHDTIMATLNGSRDTKLESFTFKNNEYRRV